MLPTPVLTWSLQIDRTVLGEVHVFAPAGRLGTLSSGDLVEALVGAITDGARLVLVDLAGVDYISSAGLLALDAVSGRVQAANGALVLCGLVEPVRLAFDLAGLLPHFAVAPARDLALAQLAAANTSPAAHTSRSHAHHPEKF
jgi:anti-anti-sigma factor